MRATDLLVLAETYCRATGERLWPVSALATGSEGTLYRIRQGHGCHTRTAERAWEWFDAHWPEGLAWPEGVPRPSTLTRPGAATVEPPSTEGEAGAGGSALSTTLGRDCRA